jgi:dihydrolipoamide dehydrogenase
MYDIVVIGGGPGGYVAAIRGAHRGAKVALVEFDKLGGTCLNRGCIPTKAMVRSAEVYETARHAEQFGTEVSGVSLNFTKVMAWKDRTVRQLVGGVEQLMKANGIDVYAGKAQIVHPGLVEVAMNGGGTQKLDTKNIIIATGSAPQRPPLSDEAFALTISSDDALELPAAPASMLVIGGGVLGIEFACIYAAFGTQITAIKRTPGILPPVDEELGRRLQPILKKKGITINAGVFIQDIKETPNGHRLVTCKDGEGNEIHYEVEKVLVAMGRVSAFGGLDLDRLGVKYDKYGIKTDSAMRTAVPGVYAIGDVVGKTFLAPVASAEGMVAADNCTGRAREMRYEVVPSCVFSIPECASVGLMEKQCVERGIAVKISKFPYVANGKAQAMGETDGIVKIIADAGTGKLLGMHILGAHATDLIHEGAVLLTVGAHAHDLADTIHAHPTLSEIVMEAAHGIEGEIIHQAPRRR